MPFEKGRKKTGGRAKGTPNTNGSSAELRERVQRLLDSQYDRILADLESMEPKERVSAWIKLLDFALPKLQRTENSTFITAAPEVKQWIIEIPAPAKGNDTSKGPAGGRGVPNP